MNETVSTVEPISIQRIKAHLPKIEGWCGVDKACQIANIILENPIKLAVEIGVFAGRSLIAMAFAVDEKGDGKVYGIDPWERRASLEGTNSKINDEWWSKLDYDYFFKYTIDLIHQHGLSSKCIVLRLHGDVASAIFGEQSIDLLHIDGNHSEETSCKDVDLWFPKVSEGGFIVFDDINWPTTQKAVKKLEEKCEVHFKTETYAIFKKKSS